MLFCPNTQKSAASARETALWKRPVKLLTAEALVEALNTSAGVDQLLLTSVERMALGANFDVDLRLGGTGLDDVAACAGDGAVNVIRIDTLRQSFSPQFWF